MRPKVRLHALFRLANLFLTSGWYTSLLVYSQKYQFCWFLLHVDTIAAMQQLQEQVTHCADSQDLDVLQSLGHCSRVAVEHGWKC